MSIDKVFEGDIKSKFSFDESVASVFDDMLLRSVPYYKESQDAIIKILSARLGDCDKISDLGCSTGNILFEISQQIPKNLKLIGIDNSKHMIKQAQKKNSAFGGDVMFIEGDLLDVDFSDSDVILASYTLQFIRPLQREELVKKIYNSLKKDGIFIFSEKLISKDIRFDKEMIDIYHDFKRSKGYSNTEIAKKREALENVLIPYSEDENIAMMKNSGFKHCEVIFRWFNFATFVALK